MAWPLLLLLLLSRPDHDHLHPTTALSLALAIPPLNPLLPSLLLLMLLTRSSRHILLLLLMGGVNIVGVDEDCRGVDRVRLLDHAGGLLLLRKVFVAAVVVLCTKEVAKPES